MLSQPAQKNSEYCNAISIALFDDHERLRDSLAALLAREPGLEIIASGRSRADALAAAEAYLPDVVVLDINMPGDGLTCTRELKRAFPAISIIVLTSDDSEQTALAALQAGASALIDKGAPFSDLVAAISDVAAGYVYLSPKLAELLLPMSGRGTPWFGSSELGEVPLTYREEQILSRLAQGLTAGEIGPSVGLDAETVSKFLANILRKVHDQAGLTA